MEDIILLSKREKDSILKPAYQRGIEFIAFNDEVEQTKRKEIEGFISVITLSETLGVSTRKIAKDVVKLRNLVRKSP